MSESTPLRTYRLQQYLFDQLGCWATQPGQALDPAPYELGPREAAALQDNDIGALYGLGVHPVLLNAWCRATGHPRDEYRRLLAPYLAREREESTRAGRTARWRTSS
jgi:hypothetical protein